MNWKLWFVLGYFVLQALYAVAIVGKPRDPRGGGETAWGLIEYSFVVWCAITGAQDLASA